MSYVTNVRGYLRFKGYVNEMGNLTHDRNEGDYKIDIDKGVIHIPLKISCGLKLCTVYMSLTPIEGKVVIDKDIQVFGRVRAEFLEKLKRDILNLEPVNENEFDSVMLPKIVKILSPLNKLYDKISKDLEEFNEICMLSSTKRA